MLEHVFADKIIQQAGLKPILPYRNATTKSSTTTTLIEHWTTTTLTRQQNPKHP